MLSDLRLFVVLVKRKTDFVHPRERYHWHFRIENEREGEDGRIPRQYCHTLEVDKFLDNTAPETFEEAPFIGKPCNSSLVQGSEIEVAKFNARKRPDVVFALCARDQALQYVRLQQQTGETCRFFIKAMLSYFDYHREEYGITSLTKFHFLKQEYVRLGLLPTDELAAIPDPPPVPSEAGRKLRSKKSLFRLGIAKDTRTDEKLRGKKSIQTLTISQPRPIDPRSIALPPTPPPMPAMYATAGPASSSQDAKQAHETITAHFRTISEDAVRSNHEIRPPWRSSDNSHVFRHRRKLVETFGIVHRRSAPT